MSYNNKRQEYKIRKQVEVPISDFEWLQTKFHGASLNWVTSLLLHAFREVCENPTEYPLKNNTPLDAAIVAAQITKEGLEDGSIPS